MTPDGTMLDGDSIRPGFREIFGDDHAINMRASWIWNRWLPEPETLDALTGGCLSCCDLTVVCSNAVFTPRIRELFEMAGLVVRADVRTYSDRDRHLELLQDLGRSHRIVQQHACPAAEIRPSHSWIPTELVSFLNNKANLDRLVSPEHVPERRLVDQRDVSRLESRLPFVLKVATDQSTGAGRDVLLCRSRREIDAARRRFADATALVVEEVLDFDTSSCFNFAITRHGRTHFLGAAEQIIVDGTIQTGSWIGEVDIPPSLIGAALAVAERGAALGYYGFCGVDGAITREGRTMIFDLNFRLNSSTVPLILFDVYQRAGGARILAKRIGIHSSGGFETISRVVSQSIEAGLVLPISFFDSAMYRGGSPGGSAALLVLGDSREEIDEYERELARRGLA